MESENHSKSDSSSSRKQSDASRHGLLVKLIGSHFFQVLIGNSSIGVPSHTLTKNSTSGTIQQQQSLPSMALDIILFGLLVIAAPLLALAKFISRIVRHFWWVKFLLGVITGVSSVFAVFLLLKLIFR